MAHAYHLVASDAAPLLEAGKSGALPGIRRTAEIEIGAIRLHRAGLARGRAGCRGADRHRHAGGIGSERRDAKDAKIAAVELQRDQFVAAGIA